MSLYDPLSLVCLCSFFGLCGFVLFSVITLVRKRREHRRVSLLEKTETIFLLDWAFAAVAVKRIERTGFIMKVGAISTTPILLLALAFPVCAEDVTLDSVAPVVVKTVPQAGVADVDSKLSEVKVTFSKDMSDGSWSWCTHSEDSFPTMAGKPRYLADKRTCVLPVKLEPGKTYAIWLNSAKFGNFKDAEGRSAVPYLLVFRTKM